MVVGAGGVGGDFAGRTPTAHVMRTVIRRMTVLMTSVREGVGFPIHPVAYAPGSPSVFQAEHDHRAHRLQHRLRVSACRAETVEVVHLAGVAAGEPLLKAGEAVGLG